MSNMKRAYLNVLEAENTDWQVHEAGHNGVGYSVNCGYCVQNTDEPVEVEEMEEYV